MTGRGHQALAPSLDHSCTLVSVIMAAPLRHVGWLLLERTVRSVNRRPLSGDDSIHVDCEEAPSNSHAVVTHVVLSPSIFTEGSLLNDAITD